MIARSRLCERKYHVWYLLDHIIRIRHTIFADAKLSTRGELSVNTVTYTQFKKLVRKKRDNIDTGCGRAGPTLENTDSESDSTQQPGAPPPGDARAQAIIREYDDVFQPPHEGMPPTRENAHVGAQDRYRDGGGRQEAVPLDYLSTRGYIEIYRSRR